MRTIPQEKFVGVVKQSRYCSDKHHHPISHSHFCVDYRTQVQLHFLLYIARRGAHRYRNKIKYRRAVSKGYRHDGWMAGSQVWAAIGTPGRQLQPCSRRLWTQWPPGRPRLTWRNGEGREPEFPRSLIIEDEADWVTRAGEGCERNSATTPPPSALILWSIHNFSGVIRFFIQEELRSGPKQNISIRERRHCKTVPANSLYLI